MSKHYANAHWEGKLMQGKGKYTLKTSGFEGSLSFPSRFEDDKSASSPEELIGAALSGCFSMALANDLDKEGFDPQRIDTEAEVLLEKTGGGFSITRIILKTSGEVPGIDENRFLEVANGTKKNCPVSRALQGTEIELQAELATKKETH